MKRSYKIEGCNETFSTLKASKAYIVDNYTPNERIKYLYGTDIACYINDNLVSLTPVIILDNRYPKFGRTFSTK